jgi:trimeric autotransporter adhesin
MASILPAFVSGGSCQSAMTFTPSAIGARNATLKISVAGVPNTINVPLMGTGGNPLPNITSISPPSVYAGSPATKVTLNGTGFLPSSVAYWDNSQPLTTTYVSPSQLTVVLPASDLTGQGSSFIYVTNPAPGGGNGAEVSLQIIGLDPSGNSVSPSSLVSGTPTNPVVISGGSFMTGATVLWNGKPLPTTYLNSGQLQAAGQHLATGQSQHRRAVGFQSRSRWRLERHPLRRYLSRQGFHARSSRE